ncbi:MAG: YXWGXW repeat-containing protein [Polyangiaceae bacterium]
MSRSRLQRFLFAAVVMTVLGCSSGLPRPPYSPQKTTDLQEVAFPPPPARVEFVPDQPNSDSVWIDGEWEWTGRVWTWKRGRWVEPIPSATFSPWATVRGSDGMLYLAGGTWRDVKGNPIDPPKAISYGKPTAGSLVDSEGVSEHTGKSIKEDKTDETDKTDKPSLFVPPTPKKKDTQRERESESESDAEGDGGA